MEAKLDLPTYNAKRGVKVPLSRAWVRCSCEIYITERPPGAVGARINCINGTASGALFWTPTRVNPPRVVPPATRRLHAVGRAGTAPVRATAVGADRSARGWHAPHASVGARQANAALLRTIPHPITCATACMAQSVREVPTPKEGSDIWSDPSGLIEVFSRCEDLCVCVWCVCG